MKGKMWELLVKCIIGRGVIKYEWGDVVLDF